MMRIGLYQGSDGFLAGVDPRVKVGLLVESVGLLLCFNSPAAMAAVVGTLLVLGMAVGGMRRVAQFRVPIVAATLISTVLWWFYLGSGTPIWTWGPLQASQESVLFGIAMGLRMLGVLVVVLVFLSTTSPDEFHAALVLLHVPYVFAFVFSLSVQLVPVFIRAGLEISEAQACRGLDLSSGSIPERIRKSMALAVPLFMHAVRQANWLTIALEVRGFAPGAMRTTYQEYRFTRTDYVVLVVFSTALLVGVVCRILGVGVLLPTRL